MITPVKQFSSAGRIFQNKLKKKEIEGILDEEFKNAYAT